MNCDKSCKKCLDQGNENCVECADGYKRSGEDRVCVKDKNKDKILTLENARYFTYGGLCIATGQEISKGNCGMFDFPKNQRKNSLLASKKWLNQKNKGTLLCQMAHNYYDKVPVFF